ncbi:MAG: hypothetical protein AAF126_16090 [Chloroflexota bacterium]
MQRRSVGMLLWALFLTACGMASGTGLQQVTPLPTSDAINATSIPMSDPFAIGLGLQPTVVVEMAGLEPGVARAQALEGDIAYTPEIENPMTFDELPVRLQFNEFYDGYTVQAGLILSDKLQSLDGLVVTMDGYVAPPLAPRLDFFVLTRMRLTACPFCSTTAEWPNDIVLVYLPDLQIISSDFPVRITGIMHVGTSVDAETGMVSLVRIYAEAIETLD